MSDEGPSRTESVFKSRTPAAALLQQYVGDPLAPRCEEVCRLASEVADRLAHLERQNQELREIKRQLEDYRDRYIDLYDSAPLGYVSLDEEGYIQEINLAGAAWLGEDRDALTGYPFADHVLAEDVPVFLDHVRKCIDERNEVTSELRLLANGGIARTVQLRSVPVEDQKHGLILCKTAMADITANKRAEEALRESEARHRAILDASVDAIITIDDHGLIESVNPATQRLFGYSPAELIGANVNVLMPSPYHEMHDTYLENYHRTGQAKIIGIGREVTGRRKDGSLFAMDLSVGEINLGGRRMFTGLVHDVSDRKRAEDDLRQSRDELECRVHERTAELSAINRQLQYERHLFDMLMDHIPQGIYFKDATGRFIRVNRAKAHCLGLPDAAAAIGKSELDFCSLERALPTMADEREVLRSGVSLVDQEEKETWPDGRTTWLSTTKMPLYDEAGRIVGTFGLSRDITQSKRAEEVLRFAKEAAEAANRAKSSFLANMSHEIRTPMNAIIGMTELVLDTPLSPQQREFLLTVEESAESLLAIINDILDFSKIEAERLMIEPVPFDLREQLGDTLKTLALRADRRGIELICHIHPEVPEVVVADNLRLRQVMINLVGNAIKFTEEGEVEVSVRVGEPPTPAGRGAGGEGEAEKRFAQTSPHPNPLPEGDGTLTPHPASVLLEFTVRDTGIGIPADKQTAIFEAFEQGDGTISRRYGGTGLGLAISSRLLRLMGGRMWVESQLGRGSQFHFQLPCGIAAEEPSPPRRERPAALSGTKVLVVDDNATNRWILEEMLTNWELRPQGAAGGEESLRILRQTTHEGQPYRLVLVDAHMSGMDGFALAGEIRRDPALGSTVIMMLSSGDQPGDVARCQELGIPVYLVKPVKQSDLFDAILLALGAQAEEEPHPSRPEGRPKRQRPLNILLAEDSAVNQKVVAGMLEKEGHAVTLAGNGRAALAAVAAQGFDLVLMDVQMPEMDGLEATAAIRARQRRSGEHVPIVAMTAHALKGDRQRCLEAGMDEYLSKPIHSRDLLEVIDRALAVAAAAEPAPSEPPAEADLVDWKEVFQAVAGDAAGVDRVVQAALEESPRLVSTIRAAIESDDQTALRLAAHTLKGSLQYFGAARLCRLAQQLEQMGQEGDLQNASPVLASLEEEMTRFVQVLAEHQ